jgi:hypothetical protein
MRKFNLVRLLLLMIMPGICPVADVYAESAGKLVAKGNRYYSAEDYDQAIQSYDQAGIENPESPQIYFNKGAALYMKGDYNQAIGMFENSALKSKDLGLESQARYNIGNCLFRESERQRDSDLKKSLEILERSIGHYQHALKLNPELKDAAHNIEVARLTMKQILDEIKKQQEENKEQQEKQKEIVERLKQLIQEQLELLEKTKNLEVERKAPSVSSDWGARSAELGGSQDQLKQKTSKLSAEVHPQPAEGQCPMASAAKYLQDSVEKQSGAVRNLEEEALSQAQEKQLQSAMDMKKALDELTQKNSQQQEQNQEEQQKENQDQERSQEQDPQGNQEQDQQKQSQQQSDQTDEEPESQEEERQAAAARDETARDIINQEDENRERRQVRRSGKTRPVEKDW